jgi:hypothetical protein
MSERIGRYSAVILFVLLVLLATPTWAQTATSSIRGTVTDAQSRVVVGATVTITNRATNATRTLRTNETGGFSFELVTPGTYRVVTEAAGFRTKAVDGVQAAVAKISEIDVQLEVGAKNEVVEVQSSEQAALVNTQDASLGNVFVAQQIGELPLEALNVVDLLSLQPGVTREGYVAGARADQSNVTLDGVDINNAQTSNTSQETGQVVGELSTSIIDGPVLRLNADAIEEFRVTTSNSNANQGRSSGSQVNLVTKSGTNNWHGGLFEFHRNTIFTANTWFNNHATDANGNSAPVPRQALIRNTFGASLGGPIVKNKAFFFYSYEGGRDAKSASVVRLVPLPTLGAGTIKYEYCSAPTSGGCGGFSTNTLTASQVAQVYSTAGIDAAAVAVLGDAAAKYASNDTSVGDGLNTGGFRFNAPEPVKLNSHVVKLDFNLTSKQTAFFRANVIHDHAQKAQWLPDTPSPQIWSHPRGLAAAHTWTLGNNWVNNFRYGYTRQAFTDGGDSKQNDIEFRFIFSPRAFTRDLSRITPVHNFTDDVSWVKGNHTFQFGTNLRVISNTRTSFANAYDFAYTNPSFFLSGGADLSDFFQSYLDNNGLPGHGGNMTSIDAVQAAGAALIGGLSEYTANFTFNKDGSLLAAGVPSKRDFKTQSYDFYLQDSWRVRQNLTLTLGLRYSLERPVYEAQGFEVQPTVPLGTYFQKRLAAAHNGQNFVDDIVINRSGPANGGPPMYAWDKNNFQPRVAFAWELGHRNVVRGGFGLVNDYYGQALAVSWDLNNTLGFTSNYTDPANTFSISGLRPLAPVFTGYGQELRPFVPANQLPSGLTFPARALPIDIPNKIFGERIESSVDSTLRAPKEYTWNLTFERQLPGNSVVTLSYIGRAARGLLARRDIAAFNNLRDPQTGVDWYTAGTALEKLRQAGTDISQIPSLLPTKINQYFVNMFPAGLATVVNDFEGAGTFDPTWTNAQALYGYQSIGFFSGNDWTDAQAELDLALANDGYALRFMQPQYGALSAWSSVGNSNYNALAASLRSRYKGLVFDFNYTYSHSLDDASGLQTEGGFGNNQGNGAFIVNPIRQGDNYANSDFDVRHSINADAVWQLPFGKGRMLLSNPHPAVEAILGGWQLSGIFRWNTGLPTFSPYDNARWATNWNVQANVTPIKPLHTCPSRPAVGPPKLFGACGDINAIYDSFRNAYPGETGPRNYLRLPGYIDFDFGLAKSWKMPYHDGHVIQLRWDVFNATNTQHFTAIDSTTRSGFGVALDPAANHSVAPAPWSNFTAIHGNPRVMQVGLRYSF